jgi:hypothetical protein
MKPRDSIPATFVTSPRKRLDQGLGDFAQALSVIEQTPDISMAAHEVNLDAVPRPAHDL